MGFFKFRLSSRFKLGTRESPRTATMARNGRFTMSRYQKCPNTLSNSLWASRTSQSKTVEKPEIPVELLALDSSRQRSATFLFKYKKSNSFLWFFFHNFVRDVKKNPPRIRSSNTFALSKNNVFLKISCFSTIFFVWCRDTLENLLKTYIAWVWCRFGVDFLMPSTKNEFFHRKT